MSSRVAVVAAFAAGLAFPSEVSAQGFGIYEQGACTMARGGAGVAQPCDDGSAIYINPAGLAAGKGWRIGGGPTLVGGSGTFTPDQGPATSSTVAKGAPPFHAYVLKDVGRYTVGFGAYVPYGLRIEWPLDFDGRFISYDSSLNAVYLQPTIAYAVTKSLAVGGGVTIGRSSVELNRREDLARVPLGATGLLFGALVEGQTDFENTVLKASGAWGAGANAGAILTVTDAFRVGVRYLTRTRFHYDGTATFTPIAGSYRVTKPNPLGVPVGAPLGVLVTVAQSALQSQPASTDLEMPAQLVAGVSVNASRQLTVFADYQYVQWSAFNTIALKFSLGVPPDEVLPQNYRDTSAVRVGVEYRVASSLRLRAGSFHNQAAAPDENVTPLLPDAARHHFTGGLGWTVPRTPMTIDLAYQFVAYDDRRGRVLNPPPGALPTAALNSGVYRSRGDLVGITVTYRP